MEDYESEAKCGVVGVVVRYVSAVVVLMVGEVVASEYLGADVVIVAVMIGVAVIVPTKDVVIYGVKIVVVHSSIFYPLRSRNFYLRVCCPIGRHAR